MPPFRRLVVRAPNWVGDAVMSLPAVEAIRQSCPQATIAVLARPSVAAVYRAPLVDEVLPSRENPDWKAWRDRLELASALRRGRFDAAILFPNSFDAALIAWLAGVPVRIGYAVKRRGLLLTIPVPPLEPGQMPIHQSLRYLELLRRAGFIDKLPPPPAIRFSDAASRRDAGRRRLPGTWVGVAPGSANGSAKRWLPERFAAAAARAARTLGGSVAVFGTPDDRDRCQAVSALVRGEGVHVTDFGGATSLDEFFDLTAACRVFLANDSGSMHVAAALDVPTLAVFGPTNPDATGPAGRHTAIVREVVPCGPCLLHECPTDHRCMTEIGADRVAAELVRLAGTAGDAVARAVGVP